MLFIALRGVLPRLFTPSEPIIALAAQMSYDDAEALLALAGFEWDFAVVKDVILCYLFQQKVYNPAMREQALSEYKVTNLILK